MTKDRPVRRQDQRQDQKRALSLWMDEWRIYKALRGESAPDDSHGAHSVGLNTVGRGPDVAGSCGAQDVLIGQIRLLRPAGLELRQARPVYVLLLCMDGGAHWVAPFSRFANPAVPGEWATGVESAPLRVLCLWNARLAPVQSLQAGWPAGSLPAAGVARALEVWRHVRDGGLREGAWQAAVGASGLGPPLEHPLDPRHEYLQEERELLDVHLGLTIEAAQRSDRLTYEPPQSERRMAAESREKYGTEGGGEPR